MEKTAITAGYRCNYPMIRGDCGFSWSQLLELQRETSLRKMQMIWIEIRVRDGFARLMSLMEQCKCLLHIILRKSQRSFIQWHGVWGMRVWLVFINPITTLASAGSACKRVVNSYYIVV